MPFDVYFPSSDLTPADIQTIVGYLLECFALGFAAGFLQRVFFKAIGLIK